MVRKSILGNQGHNAYGYCDRSGRRCLYSDLRREYVYQGHNKCWNGLLVYKDFLNKPYDDTPKFYNDPYPVPDSRPEIEGVAYDPKTAEENLLKLLPSTESGTSLGTCDNSFLSRLSSLQSSYFIKTECLIILFLLAGCEIYHIDLNNSTNSKVVLKDPHTYTTDIEQNNESKKDGLHKFSG